MNESCIYQIRSYSVFGEIVKVGEKLAFVENSWREENEVERFMYLVNKKYYLTSSRSLKLYKQTSTTSTYLGSTSV